MLSPYQNGIGYLQIGMPIRAIPPLGSIESKIDLTLIHPPGHLNLAKSDTNN